LSAAGLLRQRADRGGHFAFTVSVADVDGVPGNRAYTMSVACPVITLAPTTLPDGQVGVAYSQTIVASGGASPYSFVVTAGALPAGLSLSAGGELTGTPTAAGAAAFTVSAVDNVDCVGTEVYTLAVFVDPAISRILPVTAGQCLSANRTCVSVPSSGAAATRRGASGYVTFSSTALRSSTYAQLAVAASIRRLAGAFATARASGGRQRRRVARGPDAARPALAHARRRAVHRGRSAVGGAGAGTAWGTSP
jgi:hypothetical protein